MQNVPEDVFGAIVDAVAQDFHNRAAPIMLQRISFEALLQCSVTSRAFSVAALPHLLRTVTLATVERSTVLLALLQMRPALARSISVLYLSSGPQTRTIRVVQPAKPRSRMRSLFKGFSKAPRVENQRPEREKIRNVDFAAWLTSSDGKQLLGLMQDVKHLGISKLGSNVHATSGNIFQHMSHILSLSVDVGEDPSFPQLIGIAHTHLRRLHTLDCQLAFVEHFRVINARIQLRKSDHSQELLVHDLRRLRMLVDAPENSDMLASVHSLKITTAFDIPVEFQQAVAITQRSLPKLHHLDIQCYSPVEMRPLDIREELTVGNAISSLNTLVIRGIKLQVVFLWIIRVLASLKVSQLGEIQLYMDLVEYKSRSRPEYLTELDDTLSRKTFDKLRTMSIFVHYWEDESNKVDMQKSLPRLQELGILHVREMEPKMISWRSAYGGDRWN
jgi:hypothetical protein